MAKRNVKRGKGKRPGSSCSSKPPVKRASWVRATRRPKGWPRRRDEAKLGRPNELVHVLGEPVALGRVGEYKPALVA